MAHPSEIPAGYFFNGGVRWNPESMKGSVPFFAIKNLSVVPNAVSAAYDMMETDRKALWSMVKKNADVLSSAAASRGFSLREGGLSFNTGVIVTNDLAMACIRASDGSTKTFVGGKQFIEFEDGENSDDDRICNEMEHEKIATASASLFSEIKNDVRTGILTRLVNAACSACGTLSERQKVIENAKAKTLGQYIVENLRLDQRVAHQMDGLVSQVELARDICYKRRQKGGTFKSTLDEMVAMVNVDFASVLEEAAKLTRTHWAKCPVCVPEKNENNCSDEEEREKMLRVGVPFRVALESMAGKFKCINTCDLACCQSLYFVLLCTLALKFENERRSREVPFEQSTQLMAELLLRGDIESARVVMERIKISRENKIVKTSLYKYYNSASDCLVYLFEPSRIIGSKMPSMTVEDLKRAITHLAESKVTGKIWNCTDSRFFGNMMDIEMIQEEEAVCGSERQLPFVTGVYHTGVVEIAAACLSVKL